MTINVVQYGEEYRITFPYDPKVIKLVKNVPGRKWNPENKYWSIPLSHLGMLISQFKGSEYEDAVSIRSLENINVNEALDVTREIPDVDLTDIDLYVKEGSKLYDHQLDFMKFGIDRENKGKMSGFIVCDEMGCVSGDAQVELILPNKQIKKISLKDLFLHYKENKQYYKLGNYSLSCFTNRCFGKNTIKSVVYSGYKPTYRVTLKNGYSLKTTADHEFLTETYYGSNEITFKPLHDLNSGDSVIVCDGKTLFKRRSLVSSIEYVGEEHVYDIKMLSPYHNFVANGIVVHNCGKTLESLNLALYNKTHYGFQHCLILCCINKSKYNWLQEIEEQTNSQFEGYILGTRKQRNGKLNYNGSSKAKLEDLKNGTMYGDPNADPLPYFIIINVEAIRYKEEKKFKITKELINLVNEGWLNMIIIDEVHKNVSPTSSQGEQLLELKKKTRKNCFWLPMTGTPIVNQPTDLFLPLRLVDAHAIDSSYVWNQAFCIYGGYGGHELVGYKNMNQLKILLQPNMIRRVKDDILDLPPKIEFIEYVENTKYQQKLSVQVRNMLIADKENIVKSLNPLAKMIRLRQVNGSPELIDENLEINLDYIKKNAKLERLLELLEEIHQRKEKVIIYSNWVEPLRTIYRFIANKYNVCCFTGTMKEADCIANKERFQNDPKYTIIIGTISSLGTSHTLTAANNVIFYDEPWTASDRQQAIDRTHRISATKPINVYTILSKSTIDETVHKILYSKSTISGYMVDNTLDIYNNPKLFDILLGDTI